jgi:hypothetical protein
LSIEYFKKMACLLSSSLSHPKRPIHHSQFTIHP